MFSPFTMANHLANHLWAVTKTPCYVLAYTTWLYWDTNEPLYVLNVAHLGSFFHFTQPTYQMENVGFSWGEYTYKSVPSPRYVYWLSMGYMLTASSFGTSTNHKGTVPPPPAGSGILISSRVAERRWLDFTTLRVFWVKKKNSTFKRGEQQKLGGGGFQYCIVLELFTPYYLGKWFWSSFDLHMFFNWVETTK